MNTRLVPSESRRVFLSRSGILGVALAVGSPLLWTRNTRAQTGAPSLEEIRFALDALALDTMGGLCAFVVPGDDPYSVAQGESSAEPGALAAGVDEFLVESLDDFLPFPSPELADLVGALASALAATPLWVPPEVEDFFPQTTEIVERIGDELEGLLESGSIPAANVVTLILNLLAVAVNAQATSGAFLAPFSRLTWEEKGEVFRSLEGARPELTHSLPIGSLDVLSGMLDFTTGVVIEFTAFGAYSEVTVLDPDTRTLLARPVGWELSGFQPSGPVEGWDDFQGYFENRKSTDDA